MSINPSISRQCPCALLRAISLPAVHESCDMNKKQVIIVSSIAAVPAAALLFVLGLGLLQGMLSDGASVSILLWIIWVVAVLGCVAVAFLPFAIAFYPGLLPAPAVVGAAAGDSSIADSSFGIPQRQSVDSDALDEGEEEFDEDTADSDSGEQLFEDGALDDDFDDDFGNTFDDDDAKPKKRR